MSAFYDKIKLKFSMQIKELSKVVQKIINQYGREFNVEMNADWMIFKLQEELGEFVQSYLNQTGRNRRKPKSLEIAKNETQRELADVFCFVLLIANELDIDIEEAVKEKWFEYLK